MQSSVEHNSDAPPRRPLYETDADLTREQDIAARIGAAWNCTPKKLPIACHLDYALLRGDEAFAFCEIKTRGKSLKEIRELGGYLVNISKFERALSYQWISGLPFMLVVEFTDDLYYASFTRLMALFPLKTMVLGRKDRGDPADLQPAIVLDTAHFRPVIKPAQRGEPA